MKKKEQRKAMRKLKRNFFQEAMIRELDLEYRRALSAHTKRAIAKKKLSTPTDLNCKPM
jgi:hypothetical protein